MIESEVHDILLLEHKSPVYSFIYLIQINTGTGAPK